MSDYGHSFVAWRKASQADWQNYVTHEFVTRLGEGSLPEAAFLKYLVQDYLFLFHFARAWALGVTKAETIAEMQACAATVQALVHEEIRMHVRICAEAGIDEDSLIAAEEETANLAYTRYVLDAGHSGDFLDLMAALAPCVLGYGEIGARLLPAAGETDYGDWIKTYGGDEYQQLCRNVGTLIDEAARRRLGDDPASSPRWPSLCKRFATATRLEAGFWDMGLEA
jgi:thiaminase/transcriptional activator TenA